MAGLLVLLGMAMASALLVQYVRLPYTVVLVVFGLAAGTAGLRPGFAVDRDLILHVFLPLLLFEAALHVDLGVLRDTWVPIALLAIPGVVVSMLLVGAALRLGIGLALAPAMLLGALVSATDPVAVLATLRRLKMPHRLLMLVEGESVLNDATALVLFTLLLPVAQGGSFDALAVGGRFLFVLVGGIAIGAAAGWLGARAASLLEDHLAELTLSALIAYGSFLVAERLGVSGVIATVTCGLVFASLGWSGLTQPARNLLTDVWEFAGFLANSLLFLLIGVNVSLGDLWTARGEVALAVLATLLARAVVVYGFGLALGLAGRPFVRRNSHLVFWSGLRGALTLALALSLPDEVPAHALLLQLAAGVVLFTLLVQGVTIEPLLRWTLQRAERRAAQES